MGMGMLFAGALTGGAKALGEIADDQIKRNDLEKSRQQQIAERRQALLDEMEMKEQFALGQEKRDAESYIAAGDGGKAIGDERRYAKFREDIKAGGGGEGMSEDEIRGLFNEHYNDKVVGGSDRYYEPESTDRRDALQAARNSGASGAALKALDAEHKGMLQAERQAKVDADKEAREERRYRETAARDAERFAQQERLLDKRLGAQAARGGGGSGSGDKPERDPTPAELKAALESAKKDAPKLDDYRGNAAKHEAAMKAWRESPDGRREAELQAMYDSRFGLGAKPVAAPEKPAAQKSTVKDNPTTKKSDAQRVGAVGEERVVRGVKWVRTKDGWTTK